MHSRVYIDTNVLLDIFDKRRPFHRYSVDVIQTCFENKDIELFINSDTVSNIFYLLRNHTKLSFDKTLEKLEFISESFTITYGCSEYFEATLDICKRHIFKDYEDGLQYISAIKNRCTLIVTNNEKDFKNSSIDVITSKQLSSIFGALN